MKAKRNNTHWTDDEIRLLETLWTKGVSGADISKRLKRTKAAVYEVAKRKGLARRNAKSSTKVQPSRPHYGMSAGEIGELLRESRIDPVETRDAEHVANCIRAGGFPAIDTARQCLVWPQRQSTGGFVG